jgi:single-strand DNA-binding protein
MKGRSVRHSIILLGLSILARRLEATHYPRVRVACLPDAKRFILSEIARNRTEWRGKNMAKSVNKVILLGNVGKDPEIRSTGGGTMVANFTLATSDRFQDPQGNWQDRTEWHNLVAFKRTAEIVRDYVKKGSKLYIEGKIQTRSWDDKETGVKKYRTEIIVNDISLLSGREDGGGYSRGSSTSSNMDQRQPAANDEYAQSAEISDEDIPF